jgi:hypothetical protein
VLGRAVKEGKKFGGNFRNYSHMWEDGVVYANASKGEKPLIREFLAREHVGPWFLAVADSGQKHVLSFAPLNGPGRSGQIRFEEANVFVPDDQSLIARMTELLTEGITKDEVGSGNYYVRTMRDSRELTQSFERDHGKSRGSNWFSLAIWLAQRNEEIHAGRQAEKAARDADRRDANRVSRSLSKGAKRPPANELLEPAAGPREGRGKTDSDSKRVVRPGPAPAADTKPKQGLLPGFG